MKVTGATVHLVTRSSTPARSSCRHAVPVHDDDTPETLSARILIEEHRIYPEAVSIVLDGGWPVEGRRFVACSYQTPGISR